MSVAVIYGSAMGNTEGAANTIASKLGISDVLNVADIDAAKINSYDKSFDIIKYINLSFLEYVKSLPNAKDRRLFNTLFEAKTQKDE